MFKSLKYYFLNTILIFYSSLASLISSLLIKEVGILWLAEVFLDVFLRLCQLAVRVCFRSTLVLLEHLLEHRVQLSALLYLQLTLPVLVVLVEVLIS